ncbi:MAG: patatin-like phospholipase family protein [Aestuariibaculum sp.]
MKKLIITFLLLLICYVGMSQNEPNNKKVGLVLSGGGAKGLAHIGVLKVLDSLGVKVDYVAGTSMGAIIGSLYASGYSGNQLDSIFKTVDFETLITDDIPRISQAFSERNNYEKYAISLPFDKFKITLPSALSRGQNTYNLLKRLTLHVNEIKNFEYLPIPFFCVATNVETGEAVYLERGNLAQAVMASGALPSLFQPVKLDGQILIDGGVVNNYPIEELRKKGMDIIIGVDVQSDLATRDKLSSAPEVLSQISNFRTNNAMKSKIPKTDIYIKPDIEDYSVISFDAGAKILKNGEKAALKKIEALKQVAQYKSNSSRPIVKLTNTDSILVNGIDIKGSNNTYTRSYILGKLKIKGGENKKIGFSDLTEGVNNLMLTNNFDAFLYDFEKTKDKEGYILKGNLNESQTSTYLKLALHYDNLYKSAALANITKKRLLFNNDEISLDIIFGDNIRYNFDYFIDKGFYWSIGFKSRFNQFNRSVGVQLLDEIAPISTIAGVNKINIKLRDFTNQFYIQTFLKRYITLSIGAEHKYLSLQSETILNTDNIKKNYLFEDTNYYGIFGKLKLDTYNSKYFPKHGFLFDGDVHMYLFASNFNRDFENFSIAQAKFGYAFQISDKWSMVIENGGGFKVGNTSTSTLDFGFGGFGTDFINNFKPLLGYDFMALSGNSYVKTYLGINYEVFKDNYISVEGNWANIEDDIFASGEWFTLPDYHGYALGYGIDTVLGPVQVKYSYSPEQKEDYWYFSIGFWF